MLTKFLIAPGTSERNTLVNDRSLKRPKAGEKRKYPFAVELGPKGANEKKRRHVVATGTSEAQELL